MMHDGGERELMFAKQQWRIFLLWKNKESLLSPLRQMDVSVTKLIYSPRILASVSQQPYFKLFQRKQSAYTEIFQLKTN